MKKVLFIGDGVRKTGFAVVLHNIISNLPADKYEVHHLAINYYGDPHQLSWLIYPAANKGDLWGFNRVPDFLKEKWDLIFILNDAWVISQYLEIFYKQLPEGEKLPPVIVYFPVDSKDLDPDWFKNFGPEIYPVVYTEFGKQEVLKARSDITPLVIPHGVDTNTFFRAFKTRDQAKKILFPNRPDFKDSFVVLNANRNQPRKRIDLTMKGFAEFAKGKPDNVKLYLHMGLKDAGWDIMKLSQRYGIDKKLVITSMTTSIQQVSDENLNLIYNASDVGLNTCLGEGWGLTNHEHAATGAVQIVPDHSACKELFEDAGLLLPIRLESVNQDTLTTSGLVHPDDIANALEYLYTNPDKMKLLSEKCYQKFSGEEYHWDNIVRSKWLPLIEELA
jgi:D-inositol-3-phosphate glycosyltransferase